ncbi:MAG: hypothetical protein ACI9AD_000864 [Nitriliruptoraceae bacterium]|jgi:hypothetical protein
MTRPTVSSFDPDAPDEGWAGHEGWDMTGAGEVDPSMHPGADGTWVDPDPFIDPTWAGEEDTWAEPTDDMALDTPMARADWAYGAVVDQTSPSELLARVAADIAAWDVEGLMAEAAINAVPLDGPEPEPQMSDRPEVVVLRGMLRHPNAPDDLGSILLRGWLEDTVERSPWTALVAMAHGGPMDEDALATVVSEALDACRGEVVTPWAMLLVAAAAGRPEGTTHDLIALMGFPQEQPERLWTDIEKHAKGFPGGVRTRARAGAEALGWDGTRHRDLVDELVTELRGIDKRQRRDSFADQITVCSHGPVVVTPGTIALPVTAQGDKPYVALIVGSHPVFRLKRDWPDRNDGAGGTSWSWDGPRVLESRDLGCVACRMDPDGGKRYFVSTGTHIAPVRLKVLRSVLDRLDEGPTR